MPRMYWLLLAALCSASVFGCGPSGPVKYSVTGTVSYNGAPLADGTIQFNREDGLPEVSEKISAGKYRLLVTEGKKKVEILATRPAGPVDPAMGAPPQQQYIPEEYNSQTTLTAEVGPNGANNFSFSLKGP